MTDWRLDHVVVAVQDLAAASADYERLGFTVVRGGTHPGGWTHNALIVLADGAYLELLAPTDTRFLTDPEALSARNFLFALAKGEGAAGLALTCDDLNEAVMAMQARGVPIDTPRPGGRMRYDDVRLEWRIAMQDRSLLPFFIQDLTPRSLRVPVEPAATNHANGATGVIEVNFCTASANTWATRFASMLGAPGADGSWTCGRTVLRVLPDAAATTPRIETVLKGGWPNPPLMDPVLTHGADLRFAD